MRVLAALSALTFAVAPALTEAHTVTLRIDSSVPNQPVKVDVKAAAAGLHLGSSSAPSQQQITITTPASVVVDANVEGVMIDAQNMMAVRVAFESGGSQREMGLKLNGSRMVLRRNIDGDLVPASRVMSSPNRP